MGDGLPTTFKMGNESQQQLCDSVSASLIPRPFWEGEMAWQLPRVQTVTSAARELEDPIRVQIAVT